MAQTVTNSAAIHRSHSKKIRIGCKDKNRLVPIFLVGTAVLSIASLIYLQLPWLKLLSRLGDVGNVFWKLAHFDFTRWNLIGTSLLETISITVLSTLYSLVLGLFFGLFAAENIFRIKGMSRLLQSFFTFLRAVPTPVWVLLMMVCLGMGSAAGIAGLCVHTTAFFTKSFPRALKAFRKKQWKRWKPPEWGGLACFLMLCFPLLFPRSLLGWECGLKSIFRSVPF